MSKRASWWIAGALGLLVVGGLTPSVTAAPNKPGATKETPLKPNPSIKTKVDARIAPFTWGMSSVEAMKKVDGMIDEAFASKTEKAYNPKQVAALEKQKEKQKEAARKKLTDFAGGGGVSGYEMKAPHEFTYKNKEAALEVPRAGGGARMLFFINDRLWKAFDLVPLGVKATATADDGSIVMFETAATYEAAVAALASDFADKGKEVPAKTASAPFFGTLGDIPATHLWSDGKTEVRVVDYTKREDMPQKSVGLVYEEIATLEKLPELRVNVEQKSGDAAVDKAGFTPPPPPDDGKGKKKTTK